MQTSMRSRPVSRAILGLLLPPLLGFYHPSSAAKSQDHGHASIRTFCREPMAGPGARWGPAGGSAAICIAALGTAPGWCRSVRPSLCAQSLSPWAVGLFAGLLRWVHPPVFLGYRSFPSASLIFTAPRWWAQSRRGAGRCAVARRPHRSSRGAGGAPRACGPPPLPLASCPACRPARPRQDPNA